MLSVTYKPFMLSVIELNVIMLVVVVPLISLKAVKAQSVCLRPFKLSEN